MPSIVSIGSVNKPKEKIKGNLSFEVGETFKGRIEKNNVTGTTTIKLVDGWQFEAEIQDESKNASKGLVKFEVIGIEDEKIKLKLVEENTNNDKLEEGVLSKFIKKEGLLESDLDIVRNLIKFSMKVDKDTVINIRNLFKLKDEISKSDENFKKFLNSVVESRGVSCDSIEGKNIEKVLKDFLKVFQNITKEDIYLMVENNIELTKENIESLIKFSNNKENINDIIKDLIIKSDKGAEKNLKDSLNRILVELTSDEISDFGSVLIKNSSDEKLTKNIKELINRLNTNGNTKLEKPIINNFIDQLDKNEINDLIINIKLNKDLVNGVKGKIDKILTNENAKEEINIKENKNIEANFVDNNDLENHIQNKGIIKNSHAGKNIEDVYLNNISKNNLLEALKYIKENSIKRVDGEQNARIIENSFKEILTDKLGTNQSLRFTDTDILKEIINKAQTLSVSINDLSKSDIEEVFKGILKYDIKLSTEDTLKIKNISKELFGNNEILESVKNAILDSSMEKISKSNLMKFINNELKDVSKEIKFLDLTKDIKIQIEDSLKESREVIKNLLNKQSGISLGGEASKLSDIKVYNSLSENYYILDLPVKSLNENYECKLFIKDDRKSGKKIDSKNVNLVITVKTVNMGTIDSFLKVYNKDLNIKIKCERRAINIMEYSKDILLKALKDKSYDVKIEISKKEEEATLKNCIEFFNDKKVGTIDTRV